MQTSARPADVLLFHCGYCHTELSVPLTMQGVVGPCPCCNHPIQAPMAAESPLFLPPLDGSHETDPLPPSHWMGLNHATPEAPEFVWQVPLTSRAGADDGLLPRQLADHESLGFRAKLMIPAPDHYLDGSPWGSPPDEGQRVAATRNRPRGTQPFLDSRVWRVTRMALLVTTGGLCAGLGLFLKDRQWVAGLPWKPAPASSVVEIQARNVPVRTKAMDPADPFLLEDPSDLETVAARPALPPVALPEPRTAPVAAAPLTSGKKPMPESN